MVTQIPKEIPSENVKNTEIFNFDYDNTFQATLATVRLLTAGKFPLAYIAKGEGQIITDWFRTSHWVRRYSNPAPRHLVEVTGPEEAKLSFFISKVSDNRTKVKINAIFKREVAFRMWTEASTNGTLERFIFEEISRNLEGKQLGDTGILFNLDNNAQFIKDIVKESPASQQDFKIDDRLVRIDGENIHTMSEGLLDMLKRLRGEVGTSVKITLDRRKEGRLNFIVNRKKVMYFNEDK